MIVIGGTLTPVFPFLCEICGDCFSHKVYLFTDTNIT